MGLFSGRSRERFITLLFLAVATCVVLLTLSWPRAAQAIEPKPYEELTFPPLGEIQIPDFERYELSNGLVVYLMEDHDLPLVSGTATFRTGSYLEDFEQTGLAAITGEAIRLGGTVNHAPNELNQLLEQRAASVETSIGDTSGTAGFSTLTEDLDAVFELYADVIMRPDFDETQIALIEGRTEGSISRRNDDPGEIASREFRKLIYGGESPYARTVEYTSLENISREDIVSFYERTITPENTILGIVGDFDPAQMKTLIAQTLGNWQAGNGSAIAPPPEGTQQRAGLFFVNQPQLTQSTIHIGHIGGELRNPYHASMSVLNEVLNGFGGRLFNEIRSRQGLAYSVYAFWSPRFDYNGIFIGGGSTRSEATVPFIQSMYKELEKVRENPITETELAFAKDSVLNSFVFNFQTPNQTLARLIRYEYYDYPTDFVFQFRDGVEQATTASVLEAAQVNLDPEKLITIVVGNSAEIVPDLSTLGAEPVAIDVTIPTPAT